MLPSHPATFAANHGGVHTRCRNSIKLSDNRIASCESLDLVAEPLQIYCHHCEEDFTAITLDVWMFVSLLVRHLLHEMSIKGF